MEPELISQHLDASRRRMETLVQRSETARETSELLQETFAELQAQMDELEIVNSSLLEQNDRVVSQAQDLAGKALPYREIFASVPVACIITDAAGSIQEGNFKAGQLLNVASHMLRRKPLVSYIPQQDRRQFRMQLARLQEHHSGTSVMMKIVPRGGDGEPLSISADVAPIQTGGGNKLAFRWILYPSSNEQYLEDRVKQLEAQLDAARSSRDQALGSEIGAKRQLEDAIAAAQEAGLQAKHAKDLLEHIERHIEDFKPAPRPEPEAASLACSDLLHAIIGYSELIMEEVETMDTKAIRSDAERIASAARQVLEFPEAIPVSIGKIAAGGNGSSGSLQVGNEDFLAQLQEQVAEHRRSKDAMVQQHERQERRLQERTRQLQEVTREMEGISKYLSGNIAVRLQRLPKLGTQAAGLELQSIANTLDRTAELAVLSRAPLATQPVDVSRLFREAIKLEELGGIRKVVAAVAESCEAPADAKLLEIVCGNLVNNAFKFGPDEGTLSIVVSCRPSKEHLTWTIQDNGIGFCPDKMHLLFQPFRTLHANHPASGPGLGLATARKIIERHGGKIWAESKPGNGSTFYFSLPRKG